MAVDAQPKAGRHPLLIYSHGRHGDFHSQHITGHALANAGFVVVAIQHQVDGHIGSGETVPALVRRVEELQAAVDWVEGDAILAAHTDARQIHGLGYSLGGATVMLAAGARIDVTAASDHCSHHAREDKEFCNTIGGWFSRLIGRILPLPIFTGSPHPTSTQVFINGRVVLIAPVGQGLAVDEDVMAQSVSVLVIRGDEVVSPQFHAYPLAEALTNFLLPVASISLAGAHDAFNAPLPSDRGEDDGFDRLAFIANANAYIIDALTVPNLVTEDSQPALVP